ncbi:MAG: hypothetical protein ACOX3T_04110 [Bdellovibrionota bacterium]
MNKRMNKRMNKIIDKISSNNISINNLAINNIIFNIFIYLFTYLVLSSCLTLNAFASSPLGDIRDKAKDIRASKFLDDPAWFDDNPNLKTLFTEKGGSKALFAWVGEGGSNFYRKSNSFSSTVDKQELFITYKGTYVNKNQEKLKISIYVPHPKIANEIDFGLNDTVNKLMPPHIPIYFEKKVNIKGLQGKLYLHKNNACSIVLKLPSSSILRTYKKHCKESKELEEFTEDFDLARLKLKLTKSKKSK